jgi:hypothetical protein
VAEAHPSCLANLQKGKKEQEEAHPQMQHPRQRRRRTG